MRKITLVLAILLIALILVGGNVSTASASTGAMIGRYCSYGAWANISGSGWITVSFDYTYDNRSWNTETQVLNFGPGMSKRVYSQRRAASYAMAWAQGSTFGSVMAGCQ